MLSGASERLLVFRPGAIGDFILALPALAALRAAFPAAALTVVGPAAALPLARGAGLADVALTADDARLTPLFAAGGVDAPLALRPTQAVLWTGAAGVALAENLRALGVARVVRAPSQPPPGCGQHVADYLVESLAPLGVQVSPPAVPEVRPGAAQRARAAAFLDQQGEPGTRWLALQVGSGSPRKNWPAAHFATVAEALAAWGLRPLLVAGPAEEEAVAAVAPPLRPLRPALAQDWPLDELAALLAHCAGYVGGDSGITHLAAAVGAPVVAVFGPTDPARWAPRGPRVAIVRRPVACQPCTWEAMWACPHRGCLTELAPEAVVAAAVQRFALVAAEASPALGPR